MVNLHPDLEPQPSFQRILVTGGTGFIGSHLVRRLTAEGRQVHVLYRPGSDLSRLPQTNPAIRFCACDLLDHDRLRSVLESVRPEVIFHLAGDASLRHFDPALTGVNASIERNLRASMNLVVGAANAALPELQLLVRLGGMEEYGRGPLPYEESQREQPVSPYSASQVAVTHYLQMLAARLPFRAVTIRPALIYGPGQAKTFFIPALIDSCLQGRDFRISTGTQGRDLLFVDDLVSGLVRLLSRKVTAGEIINLGSGREYVMKEVATTIVRLTGRTIRLIEEGAARPGQIEHLYGSRKKAKELLGWEPSVDLEEGLRRTIAAISLAENP